MGKEPLKQVFKLVAVRMRQKTISYLGGKGTFQYSKEVKRWLNVWVYDPEKWCTPPPLASPYFFVKITKVNKISNLHTIKLMRAVSKEKKRDFPWLNVMFDCSERENKLQMMEEQKWRQLVYLKEINPSEDLPQQSPTNVCLKWTHDDLMKNFTVLSPSVNPKLSNKYLFIIVHRMHMPEFKFIKKRQ